MEAIYKTGYALSGGFIKGFAHLGATQALYENDIRPEIISGVSAGALAGVFLADGKEPREILELFNNKEFGSFTSFAIRARGGFMLLDQFHDFLLENLSVNNIEKLKIPMIITATDLDKGIAVHFRDGEIAPRVAASCCMPGLFTPICIEDTRYIDGGVFMNLPVIPIRELCHQVVAINVSPIVAPEYKLNVVSVLQRTYHFMSHSNILVDREIADLLIEPENLYGYSNRQLDKANEIFESGYKAALKVLSGKHKETLNGTPLQTENN